MEFELEGGDELSTEKEERSNENSLAMEEELTEKIDCQYCEDVGPCSYCERGKIEGENWKKEQKKLKKS